MLVSGIYLDVMKSTMKLGAMALAAMLVLSVFAPAALAAGAAEDETTTAGNVSVSTGEATNVTNSSARLHGEVEGLAENESATVYFTYWVEGNESNTTVDTENESVNNTGFVYDVSGLQNNTTYVYVAKADTNNTTYSGEEVTFTTGAEENETDENVSDAFGQEVSAFVHSLLEDKNGTNTSIGRMVSEFVTANNPGADKRPDHAGPPEDRGKADKERGPPADKGPNKTDKQRGPPEDKGNNKADTEDVEGDDDLKDDDDGDDDEPTETPTETETE